MTPNDGGGGDVVFVIRGPLTRQDVPGELARLGEQLARHPEDTALVVDARELVPPGAATLDLLARIRLAAGRRPVRFENVPPRLRELTRWVGLGHLLDVEHQRHPEEGEEVGGGGRRRVGGHAPVPGLDEVLRLGRQEDGDVADPAVGDL